MLIDQNNINFKALEKNDLIALYRWFQVSEVKKWWARGKAYSIEDIQGKYLPRINGLERVPSFIIYYGNEAIGYIQYYPFSRGALPEGLAWEQLTSIKASEDNCAGLDCFIGEPDYLGKGYGLYIIKAFIDSVIPKKFSKIFVDPHKTNERAIKAYQKAGFKIIQRSVKSDYELLVFKR